MEKILIQENSSTQRVALIQTEQGDYLISKDWRKDSNSPWKVGKGVTINKTTSKRLGNLLRAEDIKTGAIANGFKIVSDYEENSWESGKGDQNKNPESRSNKDYQDSMGRTV